MATVHGHGCPDRGLDDVQRLAVDRDEHVHVDLAPVDVHRPLRGIVLDPQLGVELRVVQLRLGGLEPVVGLAAVTGQHRPQGHGRLEDEDQFARDDNEPGNEVAPEAGVQQETRVGQYPDRGEHGDQEQGGGVAPGDRGAAFLGG